MCRTAELVTACLESLPPRPDGGRVTFGFDGFIDTVREIVHERNGPSEYTPEPTLESFGRRIVDSATAKSSVTVEWVQHGNRTGGHTCHVVRAFDSFGYETGMVGTYGNPVRECFRTEFPDTEIISIAPPAITDAIEFDDGKLMVVEMGHLRELDWDEVLTQCSLTALVDLVDGSEFFGIGYWAVFPYMDTIVTGLANDLFPALEDPPSWILLDTADIRGLDDTHITTGITSLQHLDAVVPTTVSANRSETFALATLSDERYADADFQTAAQAAFETLGVSRFVAHSIDRCIAVTDTACVSVPVPKQDSPKLTTSAGDHFNAGFILGQLHGLSNAESLVVGNATAGSFVRTGQTPTYTAVLDAIRSYTETLESPS